MKSKKYENCIQACSESAISSYRCASADLKETEIKPLARCIKLNNESAAICILAIQLMARESEFIKLICKLCAESCTACAIECEKHPGMEHCKICAEACRKCASECIEMSKIL